MSKLHMGKQDLHFVVNANSQRLKYFDAGGRSPRIPGRSALHRITRL